MPKAWQGSGTGEPRLAGSYGAGDAIVDAAKAHTSSQRE